MDDGEKIQQRQCKHEGCEKPVLAKGYCRKHYYIYKDTGKTCCYPECTGEVYAKDLCIKHYRKHRPITRRCTYPGCSRGHYGLGFCYRHYRRLKVHGDPSISLTRRDGTRSYLDGNLGFIELTREKWATVDAADFDDVNRFVWCAHKGKRTWYADADGIGLMHTYLFKVRPGFVVDHENWNGLDNRRSNLREATNMQNAQNVGLFRNNTSGYKGVTWNKGVRKWIAQIVHKHKRYHLGSFKDVRDAAEAYRQGAIKFGFVYVPPSPYTSPAHE